MRLTLIIPPDTTPECSFCDNPLHECGPLIASDSGAMICLECLTRCAELIAPSSAPDENGDEREDEAGELNG